MTWQTLVSSFAILAFGACVLGCPSGGVGDPCIPNTEYNPKDQGASESGAQIEDRSFQCETRLCLINHFRGRVSCPFGNSKGGSTYNSEPDCYIPGTNQKVDDGVAVKPQCEDRKDSVYCSCRCGGPDTAAKYCDCPSGFLCQEVTHPLTDTSSMRKGDKFCVRQGDLVDDGYTCTGASCGSSDKDMCGYTSNKAKQ
jgi:hypothetical protein